MPISKSNGGEHTGKMQMVGYGVILAFFLYSIIHVLFIGGAEDLAPGTNVLTIAHWNCTNDVRQAYQAVFDEFEAMKARQGVKVKIKQTSVPGEGYGQWSITQLLSGDPADLMALHFMMSEFYIDRYFVPLTSYASAKNPFNKGSVIEDLSWRDSLFDGMEHSQNKEEIFKVNCHLHLFRFFVNLDILEQATGSKEMPSDLSEMLEVCEKIKQHGERTESSVVPISCRGADKFTLDMYTYFYFSQLNGVFNDMAVDGEASRPEMLRWSKEIPDGRERLSAYVELLKELGQYFGEGFIAIDNEQAQYLFYSGNAAFYFSGSWETTAMFNETDFEVGVMPLPPVGEGHRLSKFFSGPVSESGTWGEAGYGITKACENFDLALELLQFMSSFEMNQLFARGCSYLPIVKGAEFTGHMAGFKPILEGTTWIRYIPFSGANWQTPHLKRTEAVEQIIVKNIPNATEYFFEKFDEYEDLLIEELEEESVQRRRRNFELEARRSQLSIGLLGPGVSKEKEQKVEGQQRMATQTYAELRSPLFWDLLDFIKEVKEF